MRAFSSCSELGLLFVAVCGLLIAVASRCGAWTLGAWASVVVARGLSSCGLRALESWFSSCGAWAQERRLSSCGTRAYLLHGMLDLPGPVVEPVSPASAGGFLTTEPPGKSCKSLYYSIFGKIFALGIEF